MKLIVDIPKDAKGIIDRKGTNEHIVETIWEAVKNGIPLEDIVSRIEAEKNKLNEEGELHYSKSEIAIFDKCLEFLKGEE